MTWLIGGILLGTTLIICIEVPAMLRNKQIIELWIFSVLLVLVIGLSIVQMLGIPIVNPFDGITKLVQPLADFFFEKGQFDAK